MSKKQEFRRIDTLGSLASYVAFLAIKPGPMEPQTRLIEEVVCECHERYRWGIYAMARKMNLGREDAEDVLQDILLRWTKQLRVRNNLPAPGALTTWFMTVARNAAISYGLRQQKKRLNENESAARRREAVQCTPDYDLTVSELPRVIDRILSENVTPEMQRVFALWRSGLTYPEIAEKLTGKSPEAVRNIMRKVLPILRDELGGLGWGL